MRFLVVPLAFVLASSAYIPPSNLGSSKSIQSKPSLFRVSQMNSNSMEIPSNPDSDSTPTLTRNPPRKICLMIEPTPFTHVSGYSNRFNEMLKYLSKAGDKVEILTVDTNTPESELPKEKFGYKIEHTQGFTFPLYNHISLTMDLPEMKGAKIIEKLKPDLIHCSSPGIMVFASLFYARVMRIPLVLSYHTHLPVYARNYFTFWPGDEVKLAWNLLRWVHSRADLTLCTSPNIKKELEDNGIPRVDVWRKGIDTVKFNPNFRCEEMKRKMSDGHPDDFLLVYIGRLGDEKRLKDIRPMLERMDPNTRLCFVGGGPQEDELHEYFAGTNTVFTGQLSGDDLSKAFASADVFVMPSDSETLGFVVLESMASGVPVVAAKAGGIPSLINDGVDGFLVPPGDTDGFVNRIEQLRDRSLWGKITSSARAESERWSWEAATSVLRNIQYEKALVNFHSRAFGGFGKPGTEVLMRLMKTRIKRLYLAICSYIPRSKWWSDYFSKMKKPVNN